MSIVINKVPTGDNYPSREPAGGIVSAQCQSGIPCAVAEIDVYLHPVFMTMQTSPTPGIGRKQAGGEIYLPLGHRTIVRKYIFSCIFRNAVAAEVGEVTCELIPVEETFWEFLQGGGGVVR